MDEWINDNTDDVLDRWLDADYDSPDWADEEEGQ